MSERLEPQNFRKDGSLGFGEMGYPANFSYWEGSNLSDFYDFFKWPFLTFKCQNFEKSYKINFKDEIIADPNPEVYTFKLFYIGVRL